MHGGEGFPLEIAGVDDRVFPSEDSVHVGANVGLSRKSGADVCGDVEADVFPYASGLVSGPDACIALCARPAVERDDEGACVVAVVAHDACNVGDSVQSEGVSGSYPGYVGFEYADTCVTNFFYDVALEKCADFGIRMECRLCPKSDLYAVFVCVIG